MYICDYIRVCVCVQHMYTHRFHDICSIQEYALYHLYPNIPSTKAKECQESLKIIWAVSFRCGQPATIHAPVGVPIIMVAWAWLGDNTLHNSESEMNLFFPCLCLSPAYGLSPFDDTFWLCRACSTATIQMSRLCSQISIPKYTKIYMDPHRPCIWCVCVCVRACAVRCACAQWWCWLHHSKAMCISDCISVSSIIIVDLILS